MVDYSYYAYNGEVSRLQYTNPFSLYFFLSYYWLFGYTFWGDADIDITGEIIKVY